MSIYDDLNDILTEEPGEDVASAIVDAVQLLEMYKYQSANTSEDRTVISTDAYGRNVKAAISDAIQKLSDAGLYNDYIETLTEAEYRSIRHNNVLYGIQDSTNIRILELTSDGQATDAVTVVTRFRDAHDFLLYHETGKYHVEIGKDHPVHEMEDSLLYGFPSLYSITIPSTFTSISGGCFSYSGLTEVYLPQTIQTIGSYAFSGTNIVTFDIPRSVISIGEGAFEDCENLTTIALHGDEGFISGAPWGATNATIVWTGGV
jgi:hypothetical protein